MNIKKSLTLITVLLAVMSLVAGCKVTYSFSGAKIPANARTVSIPQIPNNAAMVAPILSVSLREGMQDKFSRLTRLDIIDEDGDLAFDIEITGYTSVPTSISAEELAQKNRLTITVRVSYTNNLEPEYSFQNRTFSGFSEYDATLMLTDVEGSLIPEIVETLVTDIFNAAVSNW